MRRAAGILSILFVIGAAEAQVVPERAYYGVGRAIPVRVTAEPTGRRADEIAVFFADGREAGRFASAEEHLDLAVRVPGLWSLTTPRTLFIQAFAQGEPIGPALVMQPMINPPYAARLDRDGTPSFTSPTGRAGALSGYRAFVDQDIVLDTTKGQIRVALRPDAAPNTVWSVRALVAGGFYTDIAVHRVASLRAQAEPDVVQFGDPTVPLGASPERSEDDQATESGPRSAGAGAGGAPSAGEGRDTGGLGGAGVLIDLEPSTLRHDFGVISLARGIDPNSASSQIVIALNRDQCAALDGRYTAFAEVIDGAATLLAIASTPVNADYRAIDPPVIRAAGLVDAAPFPKKPGRVADPRAAPVRR